MAVFDFPGGLPSILCPALFQRNILLLCIVIEHAKTVAPRADMNVEIISPFALTFKIPFH
jgi:hypothetical protein